MRIRYGTIPAVLLALALSIIALAVASTEKACVAGPALVCLTMLIWLWMTLWERDKKIPLLDVGVFCARSPHFFKEMMI